MKKLIVTARIDGQTHSDLKMIAKREDRSVSYLLRKAVEQYVGKVQATKPKSARKGG